MSPALAVFCREYQVLSATNLSGLQAIYAPHIVFEDPSHQLAGLTNLQRYFEHLFSHVRHCQFEIAQIIEQEGEAFVRWQMRFSHPKLNGGEEISVPGVSHLHFSEQVDFHRDYFDLGAMLYEHIPVMGALVKSLKRRLSQ
ncbi:nuclear transport factor 2 family protein [Oceanisphaera avium]|uniref:Transcriptional regulator n=1 Tax=Oceanisphaera avium TaxID=1903694 RepID=A0A1Y0CW63_9GAMM|nr:nuclear transport factor 2 family protein [Oceanisphaera avium]ART79583.1 transcriptional regulator [Oceanisphaera avium]